MLTLDFENWVLKYLEGRLVLRVDKMKMAIHSVVFENISYLRMELQAVPPSVLHPPMTEKILGMKILQHVFKKLKPSDGSKFDFQIENEVREIFKTWIDEMVQDFLEERQGGIRCLQQAIFSL